MTRLSFLSTTLSLSLIFSPFVSSMVYQPQPWPSPRRRWLLSSHLST